MSEDKLIIEADYYNGNELIDDDDNVRVKYCIDKFINELKVHNVNCNCNKEVNSVNNVSVD